MIGQPIADLEKVTEVPSSSLYPVAMGDGSGTKAVTQEVLTKEVGKCLKVGDLGELQTENKNNLVAAINEAAQSGGGGAAVDILDTKEEIEANTESGKAAGAQAVKEMFGKLNDKLKGFEPVIDENTGKITGYKTAVGGADTVFPFSGFKNISKLTMLTASNSNMAYTIKNKGRYIFVIAYTQAGASWFALNTINKWNEKIRLYSTNGYENTIYISEIEDNTLVDFNVYYGFCCILKVD